MTLFVLSDTGKKQTLWLIPNTVKPVIHLPYLSGLDLSFFLLQIIPMMASNTATSRNSRPPTIPPISASDRKSPLDSEIYI